MLKFGSFNTKIKFKILADESINFHKIDSSKAIGMKIL